MTAPTKLATAGPRFTPVELADLLGLRARPTHEQADIIAAPVEPLLVVAGAGSGKTETMAARVVWLVANGHVRPEQILGLTFTRKAAGELATRVRQRLGQLVRRLGIQEATSGEPTVATYHSYAARIVTEHGVRAGFEPSTRLLTEASCWQIADSIVRAYHGDMSLVEAAPTTVTDAVMRLAAELSEHLKTPDDVAAWTGRFYAELTAPPGRMLAPVAKARAIQQARLALLPLVREYSHRKRDIEAMDFGDQLARAATVALQHAEVGQVERDRYRVVLLDEYQDTSHAQVTLLNALFGGGHPVTAVGDPCQSIYGWRGASAGTLDRFPAEFPNRRGHDALIRTLSTSWRNRPEILKVANDLSRPLRMAGAHVTELQASPTADDPVGASTVRCALLETHADEAAWIAGRIVAAWRHRAGLDADEPTDIPAGALTGSAPTGSAPTGSGPTGTVPAPIAGLAPAAAGIASAEMARIPVERRPATAVLVRTRKQIVAIERALRAAGLPVEVVGLGGLLDTPEVRDVVSTLQVLADPLAGAALLRLITGARWRIGPRDLVALYGRARDLQAARRAGLPDDESDRDAPLVPGRLDEAALVDALDDLGDPPRYSPEGYRRMSGFGAELRGLRGRLDQPLPDLIADVEREMGLDVEVSVRAADTALARAHLDAFAETAARFAAETQGATLGAFLAFLTAAEAEERGLQAGETELVEGAVQILTIHAAKGLEWDIVAVAGLSTRVFPGPSTSADHYLGGLGVLPFPLRGDRAGLPTFHHNSAGNQTEMRDAYLDFVDAWRAYSEREERRLAYVSITRPRQLLLCSGYWWGDGTSTPNGPSPFLEEIRGSCVLGAGSVDAWTAPPEPGDTNPMLDQVVSAIWPQDPLGDRRAAVQEAAALVRTAPAEVEPSKDLAVRAEAERWAYEVELLLAERAAGVPAPGSAVDVTLPGQLSVSHLVELSHDAGALARRLRRPMPRRPDPRTRRGTAFHRWLEQRFGSDHLFDLDDLPGAGDEDAPGDEVLTELQAKFLESEWASRSPVAVEVGFATTVAGVVIRGRMDAVYADPDGGFDVVDWKTGRQPAGADATAAAVQLGAYRLAWAELAGVAVEQVRAAFHYVRDGATVRPADLLDAAGLVALVAAVPEAPIAPVASVAPVAPVVAPAPR